MQRMPMGNGSEWKATEDDEGGWTRTVGIAELFSQPRPVWVVRASSGINEHTARYFGNDADVSMVDGILCTVIVSQAHKHTTSFYSLD
jgi:hypothetical protein